MQKEDNCIRRIDVLAIGLFGLAVGALTLGMAQLKLIGEEDKVGVFVIAMVLGGLFNCWPDSLISATMSNSAGRR